MLKLFSIVRHGLKAGGGQATPQAPYRILCPCGTVARGLRQATHQVIPCGRCGKPLFVLPLSPWPRVRGSHEDGAAGRTPAFPQVAWRSALLAAGLALAAVIVVTVILSSRPRGQGPPLPAPEEIGPHLQAGRTALAHGKFRTAVQEFEAARELHRRYPDRLTSAERRDLFQLQRQASLLADLSSDPLEDIARQAAELWDPDGQEWQAHFVPRYQGKAVIFDTEVRRDPGGGYQVGWDLFTRDGRAKIDLGDLQLLRALPLDQPQRLLFGARLASVRLEGGRQWVVRWQPESGVLITDPGALSACLEGRAVEPDLLEVLQRQAEWSAQLP